MKLSSGALSLPRLLENTALVNPYFVLFAIFIASSEIEAPPSGLPSIL